jgi:hypothetical protein
MDGLGRHERKTRKAVAGFGFRSTRQHDFLCNAHIVGLVGAQHSLSPGGGHFGTVRWPDCKYNPNKAEVLCKCQAFTVQMDAKSGDSVMKCAQVQP